MADLCYAFLRPLLVELNGRLDRRLVRTFLGLVIVIITHRHRNQGLLLSELGGYLLPPAPGTGWDQTTESASAFTPLELASRRSSVNSNHSAISDGLFWSERLLITITTKMNGNG